jgi:hypothetical protein
MKMILAVTGGAGGLALVAMLLVKAAAAFQAVAAMKVGGGL